MAQEFETEREFDVEYSGWRDKTDPEDELTDEIDPPEIVASKYQPHDKRGLPPISWGNSCLRKYRQGLDYNILSAHFVTTVKAPRARRHAIEHDLREKAELEALTAFEPFGRSN